MFVKVINAYLSLKVREHNLTSPGKAFHMDTFAMTDMWKGKHERLKVSCKSEKIFFFFFTCANFLFIFSWTQQTMRS